jgi:hypothetical protein
MFLQGLSTAQEHRASKASGKKPSKGSGKGRGSREDPDRSSGTSDRSKDEVRLESSLNILCFNTHDVFGYRTVLLHQVLNHLLQLRQAS